MSTHNKTMSVTPLLFLFLFFHKLRSGFGALQVGFYGSSCPKAESIIQQVVQRRISRDRTLAASLLRLQFHDCFVRGCDASLLIDTKHDRELSVKSEKGAFDSFFLRGFDVIDAIKENLEAECPSTVSCADIITIVARDAVGVAGGPKYEVLTGRRDGLVSNVTEVKLPQPDFPMKQALDSFTDVGLTLADMVTLLGAHTFGVAHCGFIEPRLEPRPSGGNQSADHPPMNPVLKAKLTKFCAHDTDHPVFMDQATPFVFDNSFYKQLLLRRGTLELDERLAFDNSTIALVSRYASDNEAFLQSFASAIVKLGSIQVLTGEEGEIRKNCRAFNNPK